MRLSGTLDNLRWFLNAFLFLLVPFTALVFVERLTAHSAFTIVGARFELYLRNGIARCQGSFRHAILLGSVAAAFLSLYIGLWLGGTRRAAALLGGVLCLSLIALSNSGGPLTSAAAVFLGWSIWPLRNQNGPCPRRNVSGPVTPARCHEGANLVSPFQDSVLSSVEAVTTVAC